MKIVLSKKSIRFKLLTKTIYRTKNEAKAQRSRFQYGIDGEYYILRPLGILHWAIGLVVIVRD